MAPVCRGGGGCRPCPVSSGASAASDVEGRATHCRPAPVSGAAIRELSPAPEQRSARWCQPGHREEGVGRGCRFVGCQSGRTAAVLGVVLTRGSLRGDARSAPGGSCWVSKFPLALFGGEGPTEPHGSERRFRESGFTWEYFSGRVPGSWLGGPSFGLGGGRHSFMAGACEQSELCNAGDPGDTDPGTQTRGHGATMWPRGGESWGALLRDREVLGSR